MESSDEDNDLEVTMICSGKNTQSEDEPPTQAAIGQRKTRVLKFDLEQFKHRHSEMLKFKQQELAASSNEADLVKSLKFKTRNMESKEAENELERSLVKADFARMKVIGQFNKGLGSILHHFRRQ